MRPSDIDLIDSARTSFSRSSNEASGKFRALSAQPRRYGSAATGPSGDALFTDVEWIGAPDASDVLVLISGVHGAEGYCGSGAQVDLMSGHVQRALDPSQAVLLVHGLNPYGFAWDRRVTHEGCDLNRNFVDFTRPRPENPGYRQLAPFLTPEHLEGPAVEASEASLSTLRASMGERAYQVARKSGQHTHPDGVFFGGLEPSEARQTLERVTEDFALTRRRFVTVVDIHTGLGPYGYGEVEDEHPPGSSSSQHLGAMFGASVASSAAGTSVSVPVTGTLAGHFQRLRADGSYVYACLEFGTFDQDSSHRVLREDAWLHKFGRDHLYEELGQRIRRSVRDHYYPDAQDWREAVLFRSRQVVRMAQHWMRAHGQAEQ